MKTQPVNFNNRSFHDASDSSRKYKENIIAFRDFFASKHLKMGFYGPAMNQILTYPFCWCLIFQNECRTIPLSYVMSDADLVFTIMATRSRKLDSNMASSSSSDITNHFENHLIDTSDFGSNILKRSRSARGVIFGFK